MYQIRDWLYIGNYSNTCDRDLLHAHKVGAILQLAEPVHHRGIASLYLRFDDGVPLLTTNISQGVGFIRAQKSENRHVLVACGAGVSRSVALAAAVLKEEENIPLWDALHQIKQVHPEAQPHYAIWQSLLEYYPDEDSSLSRVVLMEKLYFMD